MYGTISANGFTILRHTLRFVGRHGNRWRFEPPSTPDCTSAKLKNLLSMAQPQVPVPDISSLIVTGNVAWQPSEHRC